ncbi:MAG: alpha/beta hydrolase [Alphaproteobacteria bacterium]
MSRFVAAVDCGYNYALCQSSIAVNGLSTTVYASAPLRAPHPEIKRALVVIHGTDANVRNYFGVGLRAAADSGKAAETLVVAPLFHEQNDRAGMDRTKLIWDNNSNWRAGDLSTTAFNPRVSSFAVMDELIAPFADRALYPNLAKIVIAGHSAGGQYAQRYAVARRDVPGMPPVSYVVANPSSVVYLDARRPVSGRAPAYKAADFAVPPPSNCKTNAYNYGLDQPNAYVKRDDAKTQIERYRARRVTYLAGDADTDPNAPNLSQHCAAKAQGPTRFARLTAFAAFMDAFYAPHHHKLAIVPGVGHQLSRMFLSPQGMAALFED